jgi:hypothetical protein
VKQRSTADHLSDTTVSVYSTLHHRYAIRWQWLLQGSSMQNNHGLMRMTTMLALLRQCSRSAAAVAFLRSSCHPSSMVCIPCRLRCCNEICSSQLWCSTRPIRNATCVTRAQQQHRLLTKAQQHSVHMLSARSNRALLFRPWCMICILLAQHNG